MVLPCFSLEFQRDEGYMRKQYIHAFAVVCIYITCITAANDFRPFHSFIISYTLWSTVKLRLKRLFLFLLIIRNYSPRVRYKKLPDFLFRIRTERADREIRQVDWVLSYFIAGAWNLLTWYIRLYIGNFFSYIISKTFFFYFIMLRESKSNVTDL